MGLPLLLRIHRTSSMEAESSAEGLTSSPPGSEAVGASLCRRGGGVRGPALPGDSASRYGDANEEEERLAWPRAKLLWSMCVSWDFFWRSLYLSSYEIGVQRNRHAHALPMRARAGERPRW